MSLVNTELIRGFATPNGLYSEPGTPRPFMAQPYRPPTWPVRLERIARSCALRA
jgi:hypothetical protein